MAEPASPIAPKTPWFSSLAALKRDRFFWTLLLVLAGLAVAQPQKITGYSRLVDWATIAALAGLLVLTQAVESSGALGRLGHLLVRRMSTERVAALCMVSTAAILSTVLTNDVALFVIVPLTLGLCRIAPIGNPQNLFLWQLSGSSFAEFTWHMAPLVAVLSILLLVLTALVFADTPLQVEDRLPDTPLDRSLLLIALGMYLPFLVLTDGGDAAWACAAVATVVAGLRPRVLARVDWGLLLVFVLMFIDLRLVAGLDAVQSAIGGLGLADPMRLYAAGIAASQLVSNVPAAIALAEYSRDWRVMAYAVNVGGFGWMVGSLANLIALRMANDSRAWLSFHRYSLPFLLVAAAAGFVLLFTPGVAGT